MATFLKIFIVVLLVVLLAHAFIGWLRPDVTPGLSFLPGGYQVRESWRKCPRLFPYCDVDSALSCTHSDPSPLRTLLRTLIAFGNRRCRKRPIALLPEAQAVF